MTLLILYLVVYSFFFLQISWTKVYLVASDYELCHSTSKSIGDEEDTFKSFMSFNITPHGPAIRVVVWSQIVVPQ